MDAIEIEHAVEREDRHWWHRERRSIIARELRRTGGSGRAIDVGAAGGGNTRVLLQHGWQAVAVDWSEGAVEIARRRGVEAYRADPRFLPVPSAEYDFALALNVLEHVEDDRAVAAEIARVLRPDGRALIAVPADPTLWSTHDLSLGRVRRYTREALADVIRGADLLVERMWSWNVLLRPVVSRRRRHLVGCDLGTPPPVLNGLLSAVIRLERHLPVTSLPGVSLMAGVRHRVAGPADGPAAGLVDAMAVSAHVRPEPPSRRP
ncbi:class I SAM-dependent methyltransferase [Actinomadura sp. HBU206391]|uniref:class I SAM-dependent methyltransferase n=1 Tax=Actinomadura sp. HBU206391 TaxID=2731692 RepID=UPI00164F04F6|nr:class I SAM-dependent methyltransferase [Actinomadura sp. HBU206391]MBC6456963.1 class I SAM-dependent methyltransferase [Actinomadura sp. HBU206391]